MTKNGILLSGVALVLAAIYLVYFTDLFRRPQMLIIPMVRADRPSRIPRADDLDVYPVLFKLGGEYRLTSVKVVAEAEFATNKYAPPLWHMVADTSTRPTDVIIYGANIRGMKPKVPRSKPQPLDPNLSYLLFVEAGKTRGQTNFSTKVVTSRLP